MFMPGMEPIFIWGVDVMFPGCPAFVGTPEVLPAADGGFCKIATGGSAICLLGCATFRKPVAGIAGPGVACGSAGPAKAALSVLLKWLSPPD